MHISLERKGNYSYNNGVCSGVCYRHNNSKILVRFVVHLKSQYDYNEGGIMNAVPILLYPTIETSPDITYRNISFDTSVDLFDAEMKYFHHIGLKVLAMVDLGYDADTNSLYIKR
jgi:hypothetical protein